MKKYNSIIKELLVKFLDGQTSEEEELALSEYFCNADDIPAEWQVYKEMFHHLRAGDYRFCEEEINAMLMQEQETSAKFARIWPWAAACVVIAIGISISMMRNQEQVTQNHVVEVAEPLIKREPFAQTISSNIRKERQDEAGHHEKGKIAKTTRKHYKTNWDERSSHQRGRVEKTHSSISTSELLETIDLFADVGSDCATIIVSQAEKGLIVNTISMDGQANSYMLRRCCDDSSIQLVSNTINF